MRYLPLALVITALFVLNSVAKAQKKMDPFPKWED